MLVSGVVYTFIALLSMFAAIGAVLYGVYLVSMTVSTTLTGSIERASFLFLQAAAFGLAAYSCAKFANYMASRSLELLNNDEELDEELEDSDY
jgi:hypothetical protein